MTANSMINLGTAKDVNALRKSGQLTAAFELANELLITNPENVWNKRAMGWVLLEALKSENGYINSKEQLIQQLADLQHPMEETIFYDQFRWKLAMYLFQSHDVEGKKMEWLLPILETVLPGSSPSNKFLLKALIKNSIHFVNFSAIMDIWGWINFDKTDCAQEILPTGKRIPSLAERAHIATAKCIIDKNEYRTLQVTAFIEQLRISTKRQPKWHFALYYYAILLQKTGREQEALTAFIPFAKEKSNDFWVWDLLATLHGSQDDMQLACYSKALLCKIPDKFSLKIRFKLAQLLINRGNWVAARIEIEKIIETRQQNNWKVSNEVLQVMLNPAYQNAVSTQTNNHSLYTSHKEGAEMLIVETIEEEIAIIWNINLDKNTAQYFVDENIHGGFSLNNIPEKMAIGDMVRIRLEKIQKVDESFYKVKNVNKATATPSSKQMKKFMGIPKNLGRVVKVSDVLIPSHIAEGLNGSVTYNGIAIVAYDYTRKKWGWEAFKIIQ